MAKKYEINMCEGNILKKIILFTIPLICTGVLQLLYNAADIIVVGRFAGKESLAAVGSTSSLINLMTNLFIGCSAGINVIAARAFSLNNKDMLKRATSTAVMLGIISGFLLMILGLLASKPILKLMGNPEDVIDLASVYMKIFFLGTPASMVYNFAAAVLRAMGDTRRPLYFLTISGMVNVLLNLLFVIKFRMNVAGVALATIISQYISAGLVLYCLIKSNKIFSFKTMKIHKAEFFSIIKIGIPAGFQGAVFSFSNVIIQSTLNSFGSAVMAGNAAASNIEGFVYTAMNAFHHCAITYVGQNFSSKNMDVKRIKKGVWTLLISVSVVGAMLSALVMFFATPLLSIYTSEEAVIKVGIIRFIYLIIPYFTCGFMDVAAGVLRGLGHSLIPMIISLFGACVLRIVWVYTLFAAVPTLDMLYFSYPVSWVVTAAVLVVYYKIVSKKQFAAVCKDT